MIPANTWVRIHTVILEPRDRADNLPEETKKQPLECWMKGFLTEDASVGEEVTIRTLTGRKETGTLLEAHPSYLHTYGAFVPEILRIDDIVKHAVRGGDTHE